MTGSAEAQVADAERQIRALKHRYWRAGDAKDVAAFRACFADGAVVDFGPLGSTDADGMTEIFRSLALARHPDGGPRVLDMHHGIMDTITVHEFDDGAPAHATGVWTLSFRQIDRVEGTETVTSGDYADTYTVEDGEWKIASTRFTPGWSITRPIDDAVIRWPDALAAAVDAEQATEQEDT